MAKPSRRRMLYLGGALVALCASVWLFSPSSKPREEAYRSTPRATKSDYDPPRATPVATSEPLPRLSPTAQQQPQPAQQQQQPPPLNPGTPPSEPKMASFSAVAPIPEYMKPKVAAPAPDRGGIVYKASKIEGSKAFTIADQSLMMLPQPIACIMDTMVITGSSGEAPFQCHLEHDVLSPTSVVLMEAGTQVLGYYKSMVSQGDKRVVAVTAHATTPNGVVVPLGGPVADDLGAAGVPGSVDNHWGERFGGALLLSLFENAVALGQSALSKDGSTSINLSAGSGGIGSLSQQLLSSTINIPPTITVPQGTRVRLWTTRFIDFSDSYRLETRR